MGTEVGIVQEAIVKEGSFAEPIRRKQLPEGGNT